MDLVEFKQLTIPQFARLNFSSSEQSIRRTLGKLYKRRKPLIKRIEFKKVSHFGRLSYVHSISTVGLKALETQLKYPINKNVFAPETPRLTDDYFHRVSTVDFHIFMHLQASIEEYQINKCDQYFIVEKILGSFQAINKIILSNRQSIIPDLVVFLSMGDKRRLVLFELHNGNDKSRIKDQIKQHALCLTGLFAHKKYNIQASRFYYILLAFEKASVMEAVIKDLSKDNWYRDVAQFFLYRPLNQLDESFLSGWVDLKGKDSIIKM